MGQDLPPTAALVALVVLAALPEDRRNSFPRAKLLAGPHRFDDINESCVLLHVAKVSGTPAIETL